MLLKFHKSGLPPSLISVYAWWPEGLTWEMFQFRNQDPLSSGWRTKHSYRGVPATLALGCRCWLQNSTGFVWFNCQQGQSAWEALTLWPGTTVSWVLLSLSQFHFWHWSDQGGLHLALDLKKKVLCWLQDPQLSQYSSRSNFTAYALDLHSASPILLLWLFCLHYFSLPQAHTHTNWVNHTH